MVKKIGNQSYPETVSDILADPKVGPVFRTYLKGQMASENAEFLDALAKRFDPKKLYKKFIDPKAPSVLNVPYKDRKPAMDSCRGKRFQERRVEANHARPLR